MAEQNAANDDVNKKVLDEITTCCICTEVYTDPKALPCLHTFCMNCIQETGLKSNKGPGDEMPCPLCRRLFKIPPEGCSGLPKNFFIQRLIDASDPSSVTRTLCTVCLEVSKEEEGKIIPTAETYCVDCKKKLCELCRSDHKKFKLTRNHKLVAIDAMKNLAPCFCELHQKRVLDVYCADCKTVVCAICFIDNHKGHNGSDVDKFADGFRKKIENNAAAISACRSKVQTKQSDLLKLKENIQESVKKLECDILNRRDKLKQLIDKHATAVLEDLCSIKQSKLKEVQMASDDVETIAVSLKTYNSYCQTMMAKGSASDICREFSDLSATSVVLQEQCQSTSEREIMSFNFRFQKSELDKFLDESWYNLVGEIKEQVESKQQKRSTHRQFTGERKEIELLRGSKKKCLELEHKLANALAERDVLKEHLLENNRKLDELRDKYTYMYKSDPVLLHTFKTISVKKKKWNIFRFSIQRKSSKKEDEDTIAGITILDKELFVAVTEISEVEVYDSVTFSFSRRLKLKELNFPFDIASCSRNKCLYIFHFSERDKLYEILRVDPTGKVIKKWSTGLDISLGLSVTKESNVILANNQKHKLNEYSADGDLIREIYLSSDAGTLFPVYAIKLANGDFVVSHGDLNEDDDDDFHRVCVLDSDGKLKKSFGGKRGASIGKLDCDSHLSVLGNGFVMVADGGNNRVLLLNSDLEFKREFLSEEKHGLEGPLRILLDESMDRLFVVNCANSQIRILVFLLQISRVGE